MPSLTRLCSSRVVVRIWAVMSVGLRAADGAMTRSISQPLPGAPSAEGGDPGRERPGSRLQFSRTVAAVDVPPLGGVGRGRGGLDRLAAVLGPAGQHEHGEGGLVHQLG